jgi:hypothetical protein
MRTIERDDVEYGTRGHRNGCCGGSDCCGGQRGGHRSAGSDESAGRRRVLEKRQRDLEETLAEVTSELRDLGIERP